SRARYGDWHRPGGRAEASGRSGPVGPRRAARYLPAGADRARLRGLCAGPRLSPDRPMTRILPTAPAVLLLTLAFDVAPAAGQAADARTAARVDSLFAEWNQPGSPGAAVAVLQDGRIVLERGYGRAQLEYDVPITPATVFHVASVTKQFTAFSIALLAQRGALSLDDDIRSHLPEPPDLGHRITIRQLIHHTSGIRDQWELLAMAGWRLDDVI